jgi:hypothetical protein
MDAASPLAVFRTEICALGIGEPDGALTIPVSVTPSGRASAGADAAIPNTKSMHSSPQNLTFVSLSTDAIVEPESLWSCI